MHIYLKEKIGNPDLFTGRRKELAYFSKWIDGIPKGISKSTAILSRRKTGKTALMQRLYNLTFEQQDGVIPFTHEAQARDVVHDALKQPLPPQRFQGRLFPVFRQIPKRHHPGRSSLPFRLNGYLYLLVVV